MNQYLRSDYQSGLSSFQPENTIKGRVLLVDDFQETYFKLRKFLHESRY